MQEFEPHGKYRIEDDGRILKVFVEDTANRELMEAYAREARARVAMFEGRPFAFYLEYLNDALVIGESLDALKASLLERRDKGLCAVAVNLSRVASPLTMLAQIEKIYDGLEISWRAFDDYEGARHWLSERIADADGMHGRG